jgi:hypothetical protein
VWEAPILTCAAISPATSSTSWVVGDDDDGNGGTIDQAQTTTIVELIEKAKVGPKFLKYMRARSIEEAGSLEAAVATIAARDYRKAISTLEEQMAKAEVGHAPLS